MKRREALAAKDEGRKPRTLYAWDFLLGVEDVSRQGALRYRRSSEEAFLAHDALTVPPVANLNELEVVAREITAKRIDDLTALRQWLKVLGGPRGVARRRAPQGQLHRNQWQLVDREVSRPRRHPRCRRLGGARAASGGPSRHRGAGLRAAPLQRRVPHLRVFQRFDRSGARRRSYASAMALLRKGQSEGTSYLELAEFLHARGAKDHIASDLEQLFRRVAFNVAIGNRDDHLRNHGFLLTPTGWRRPRLPSEPEHGQRRPRAEHR